MQILEEDFTEEEVKVVVMDLKSEQASGPDGFIGIFFKKCWEVIKEDLMAAVQYFFTLHGHHFNVLNSAQIYLIPKTSDAARVTNF